MKQILLILAVVALVGCGESKKEEAAKAKAAAEAKVTKDKAAADWKVIEKAIRKELKKPTGELTQADLEKVTTLYYLSGNQLTEVPKGLEKLTQLMELNLANNQLTNVKGLENLTKLEWLHLHSNQLTDVKGLEKLAQLTRLDLDNNPDLTKAGVAEVQNLQQPHEVTALIPPRESL